jgi:hypothetical protein
MSDMTYANMMNRIKPDAKLILTTKEKMRWNHVFALKTGGRMQPIIRICIPIVAVLLLMVSIFNVSPALSYAVQDIPVVNSIVNIITFHQYDRSESGADVNVSVPEIRGLLDPVLQDKLNAEFRSDADAVIRAFEADVARHKSEFGDKPLNKSIESDYTIRTSNDRILSLDVYLFSASGSSDTVHHFITIDKQKGMPLDLDELFDTDADYITPVNAYIRAEMSRINADESGLFWIGTGEDSFTSISPEQNFYIDGNGQLVICFDKYEVAAGAQGSPEFVIPKDVIRNLPHSDLLAQ